MPLNRLEPSRVYQYGAANGVERSPKSDATVSVGTAGLHRVFVLPY